MFESCDQYYCEFERGDRYGWVWRTMLVTGSYLDYMYLSSITNVMLQRVFRTEESLGGIPGLRRATMWCMYILDLFNKRPNMLFWHCSQLFTQWWVSLSFYHSRIAVASYVWNWCLVSRNVAMYNPIIGQVWNRSYHTRIRYQETSLIHCLVGLLLLMLHTRNNTRQWTHDTCISCSWYHIQLWPIIMAGK